MRLALFESASCVAQRRSNSEPASEELRTWPLTGRGAESGCCKGVKLCERHLVSGTTSEISDGLNKAADKLRSKKARVTVAAVTGTVVLAGALTAVGVSAHADS